MINLTDRESVKKLQNQIRLAFDNTNGEAVMEFLEQIGNWWPRLDDSNDTNAIIARDANRRLIGTIKSLMKLTPEQVVAMAKNGGHNAG